MLRRLLAANASGEQPVPAVIDADALSLLAGWDGWWEQIGPGNVLTPHAGEMARLMASDPASSIATRRPGTTARRAAERWRQVVVLKGPFTAVADPAGRAWVYPHANPALATAGTGDVLAGLTAGLLAQGMPPRTRRAWPSSSTRTAGARVVARRASADAAGLRSADEIPAVLAALAARTGTALSPDS